MLPERIRRLLTAYVDGELGAQQCEAVKRLLRRSSEARELLRDLENDAEQLRGLPRQALGEDFAQRVLQVIASREGQSARPSVRMVASYLPAWPRLATAAAVLLALGLGSFVYFAANNHENPAQLAVRTGDAGRSFPQEDLVPSEPAAPSPGQRDVREPLGPPVLEAEEKARPSPTPPRPEDHRPRAVAPSSPLASPVRQESASLQGPHLDISLAFDFRDLDQEKQKNDLHEALRKQPAQQIELRCTNTVAGIERLQKAFQSCAIRPVVDQDARAILELRMGGTDPSFAVYVEDITAEEMIAVLQQLRSPEPRAEGKRQYTNRFEHLTVTAMPREGQQKRMQRLGIDLVARRGPKPNAEPGEDMRKPLSTTTREPLKGQGGPQPDSDKPAIASEERQVLLMVYTPGRARHLSTELKRFLESRKECREGTLQILLILRSGKG